MIGSPSSPDPAAPSHTRPGPTDPRILIEYDVQEPLAQQTGDIHAVDHDSVNDYRMHWLGQQDAEHPPQPWPGGPGPGPGEPGPDGPAAP